MNALVTGAVGQDGFYLCRLLSERGYTVYGLYRGQDEARLEQTKREYDPVTWVRGDVTDASSMASVVAEVKPDLVFNMAGLSFVGLSWQMPQLYMQTNAVGFLNVLEACRHHALDAHIVQASTSEMYGNANSGPMGERSPMVPVSPYGVSKLAAHRLCSVYRESYGMHVSSAISFNHESPRRPPIFVTRKVTQAAARSLPVVLGNLEAKRDWGFAGDFVEAYLLMAEAQTPDDYVVGTGETHSIRELCSLAYGPDFGQFVTTSPEYTRPNELSFLKASPLKIERTLGWKPKTDFPTLVQMMVECDSPVRILV